MNTLPSVDSMKKEARKMSRADKEELLIWLEGHLYATRYYSRAVSWLQVLACAIGGGVGAAIMMHFLK